MFKSLNSFKANLTKDGTISLNRYDVTFLKSVINTRPTTEQNPISFVMDFSMSETLKFRCESINIPGIQVGTTDLKLYGGMPVLKVPNTRIYDEVQMTFMSTRDMKDKYFFEEWLNEISDFTTNTVAYYNTCASDIVIDIYNETNKNIEVVDSLIRFDPTTAIGGQPAITRSTSLRTVELEPVYTIKLLRAIPTRIETFQVGWAETDSLLKYTVNFAYETIEYIGDSNVTKTKFSHLDKKFN